MREPSTHHAVVGFFATTRAGSGPTRFGVASKHCGPASHVFEKHANFAHRSPDLRFLAGTPAPAGWRLLGSKVELIRAPSGALVTLRLDVYQKE